MAARAGHGDIAVGNVIGSNIFNLYAVMGATSLAAPIIIPESFISVDFWVMAAAALIILPFALKDIKVSRKVGFVFLSLYVAYLIYLGITNV
jgi:cation:H+ antiporter